MKLQTVARLAFAMGAALLTTSVAALAGFNLSSAYAAAPMVKTQAPGFYRVMVGDFEVTVLSDGTADLAADKLLGNVKPAQLEEALAKAYLKPPIETSDNAFLVNTGEKLLLVDAGSGKLLGPTRGNVQANLVAAGYKPEQVDEIFITHMHTDHVGGLADGDKPIFSNAVVRADKREADYWLSEENMNRAPEQTKRFFRGAMASINPYIKAGRFKPFEGDMKFMVGFKAISTPGHTPGHACYIAESKGQKMVFLGDLLHVAAIQFSDPSVTIAFDVDPNAATVQREKAFGDAAKGGYLVGATHLAFPGIGRLRAKGKGFVWVPANYTVPR